jgi:hypothetical protein
LPKTHIFGELDLDLSKGPGKIYDEAFRISEMCGYFVDLPKNGKQIIVSGSDNDVGTITFNDEGKVISVHHYQMNDESDIITPVHEVKIET